ncbi:uncharacterized protein TrAFT101_010542 [Trichoderma asperellum]|uniref:uncharacterized protein n=1 Tax=Trichoderma asperellum TaxID=101201 RepID=UPI00331B69E1|nr:hypothetical protein TrAFT101_010542 [Trichoderma asperellum]
MKFVMEKDHFRLVGKVDKLQQDTSDNTAKTVSEIAKLKTELKAGIQAVIEPVVQAVLSKSEADHAAILKDIQSFMEAIVKRFEEN